MSESYLCQDWFNILPSILGHAQVKADYYELNLTSIWIFSLESGTVSLHTSLADPVGESHLLKVKQTR